MTINEMIKEQRGIWKITYRDNYKIVIDLDNMMWDEYTWYKATNELENEIVDIDSFLKNIIEYKKIEKR